MNKLDADKLKVAVFDWDGTLVESRTPRLWAVNQIMEQYNLPDWESTRHLQNANYSFMDNFPLVFGDKADEAYEKYFAIYKANVTSMIKVFDGVRETLDYLKSRNVKIAIMTNKDRRLFEYELSFLFSPDCFEKIVCGHEAPRDKPYGDHAVYTLDGLIAPEEVSCETVWVVGDSVLDNMCAAEINALPIRITLNETNIEKINHDNVLYFETFADFYHSLVK